jgi:hypothetical protein
MLAGNQHDTFDDIIIDLVVITRRHLHIEVMGARLQARPIGLSIL